MIQVFLFGDVSLAGSGSPLLSWLRVGSQVPYIPYFRASVVLSLPVIPISFSQVSVIRLTCLGVLRTLRLCLEINFHNLFQECRAVREGFVARLIILEATLVRDIQAMEEWWWMGGTNPTFWKGYSNYPSLAALKYLIQEGWRHRLVDGEPFPLAR
jgi:hypothetical protein